MYGESRETRAHDLKPIISKFLHKKWQQRWNMNINNKLFQIQPTLGEWRPAFRTARREQVVISRLRIDHTRLTHAFILKWEPQPQCLPCQTTCTVKHILIECRAFAVLRKRFFKVTSLTELFENIKSSNCPSCEKQGCTKKYDELKLINHVQTSEILPIENFTY